MWDLAVSLARRAHDIEKPRLAGYTVLEFIANGSYGDVYKASKKSIGELFAVKVMTKSRKTAKMTTEQQRYRGITIML